VTTSGVIDPGSPTPGDPLVEMGRLVPDRRARTVAGQHDGVGTEGSEQPPLDGADDGGEVGVLEGGVARSAGEEGVPAEQERCALDGEAHGAGGVARGGYRGHAQAAHGHGHAIAAIAIESGQTEAGVVDRYLQTGEGQLDSVVKYGITWEFEQLPENRDLVSWLRTYNSTAKEKVHFYGLDLSATDDSGLMPRAPWTVRATMNYVRSVEPKVYARVWPRIDRLVSRFMPDHYSELSDTERHLLRAEIDSVYAVLAADSARIIRTTSRLGFERGYRDVWMLQRMDEVMAHDLAHPNNQRDGALVRDSLMAENVKWIMGLESARGKVIVYAHDGHTLDMPRTGGAIQFRSLGTLLRQAFGNDLLIVGTIPGQIVGGTGGIGGWIGDSGVVDLREQTVAKLLSGLGAPVAIIDFRQTDKDSALAAQIARPWPVLFIDKSQPLVLRKACDVLIYIDRIAPAKLIAANKNKTPYPT